MNEIIVPCFQMVITDPSSPKAMAADGIVPIFFHAADNSNESTKADGLAKSQHRCHCERPARHQLRFRRWQAGASPQGEAGGSEAISFNART